MCMLVSPIIGTDEAGDSVAFSLKKDKDFDSCLCCFPLLPRLPFSHLKNWATIQMIARMLERSINNASRTVASTSKPSGINLNGPCQVCRYLVIYF